MLEDALQYLNATPLAALMFVVAIGYTIGRLTWRGVSLGPAGGTLGIAIALGLWGLDFTELYGSETPRFTIGALGFALFLYSVGFEAGPRFFGSLRARRGLAFVAVGTAVNVVAFGLALLLGRLFGLHPGVTVGSVAGALTSPATYAAALEVVRDRPEVAGPLAVSFAIVYPIGLVGIVFLIQFIPRWRGRRLTVGDDEDDAPTLIATLPTHPELMRVFEVRKAAVTGHPLRELHLPRDTGCTVFQVHRGDDVLGADADTVLEEGDHVLVRGRLPELQAFEAAVGPEVYDQDLRKRIPPARRLVVQSREAIGSTLRALDLPRRYGCLVLGIERGTVRLEITPDVSLAHGDVLELIGQPARVREAAEALGRLERPTHETDIGVYAGGIFLGLLVANLGVHVFGMDLTLGFAGGLLLSGIVLGRVRRIGPFPTHVPRAARQLVRDLGILLFVAEAGVRAGGSTLEGLWGQVAPMIVVGVLLSLVPVLTALFLGCRLLRMRPLDAWGSVSGGMTSSAALNALRRATDSNASAVSYAAAYAVASVLVTVMGRVAMLLLT